MVASISQALTALSLPEPFDFSEYISANKSSAWLERTLLGSSIGANSDAKPSSVLRDHCLWRKIPRT